jgi:Domain of unknown function (DUF4126)
MKSAEVIAGVLGLAVASGLNLYAAVLTVGLSVRMGWLAGLPPELSILASPWVLGIAGFLYAMEFVADKVPFVTPIWDAIHTFIRPLGGALLAVGATGQMNPMVQAVAGLVGGTVALGAHSTKMGVRLAAHAVPEPVTHSLISVAEDFSVVGLLMLAWNFPLVAIGVVCVMILAMLILIPFLYRTLKAMASKLMKMGEAAGPETAQLS